MVRRSGKGRVRKDRLRSPDLRPAGSFLSGPGARPSCISFRIAAGTDCTVVRTPQPEAWTTDPGAGRGRLSTNTGLYPALPLLPEAVPALHNYGVIRFPHDSFQPVRWIGVDLNTTGHPVVAADPSTGKVLKLGKRITYAATNSVRNCTRLYREGKLWKLKKVRSRDKKEFRAALHKIARQIVRLAESSCAGIKFEKLFSFRHHALQEDSYEFSFENGSFAMLLHFVEKHALKHGISVHYVDPSNTSKKCSRCGAKGRRMRKRFECSRCGRIIHADVNAALNIAATPCISDKAERHRLRASLREMRRLARAEQKRIGQETAAGIGPAFSPLPSLSRGDIAVSLADSR